MRDGGTAPVAGYSSGGGGGGEEGTEHKVTWRSTAQRHRLPTRALQWRRPFTFQGSRRRPRVDLRVEIMIIKTVVFIQTCRSPTNLRNRHEGRLQTSGNCAFFIRDGFAVELVLCRGRNRAIQLCTSHENSALIMEQTLPFRSHSID